MVYLTVAGKVFDWVEAQAGKLVAMRAACLDDMMVDKMDYRTVDELVEMKVCWLAVTTVVAMVFLLAVSTVIWKVARMVGWMETMTVAV